MICKVELYFSVKLVCLFFCFCSGCVWERESTSYALSYMLDTIWRLKSALQIFLSLVIVCVRVCVQWQQESSPRGFCWGLSWLTLPVQDIVQPKMNPLMSFQTWMLISLVEHNNYQILKWTKKKHPRDIFQVLRSHMTLLCEKKNRIYCLYSCYCSFQMSFSISHI